MENIRRFTAIGLFVALFSGMVAPVFAAPGVGQGKWKRNPGVGSRELNDPLADSPGTPGTPGTDDEPIIDPSFSVARVWNETLLDAIRIDRPKPPVHGRNLFHLAVAMWDAWAAFDPVAIGYVSRDKYTAEDVEAARREAISYAAYRLLMHRFPGGGISPDGQPCQPGAEIAQADFNAKMEALGYDPAITTTEGDSPAAIGNRIGQAVIAYGQSDGSTEDFDLCYHDPTGYTARNPSLVFDLPGTIMVDPNHWQQLAFDYLVLQNGIVIGAALQKFVGIAWGGTKSFAIPPVPAGETPMPANCDPNPSSLSPIFNPGCPPQLGGVGDEQLKAAMVELIRFSSWSDPTDGVTMDLSPASRGNTDLGTDNHHGRPINPYTGEPYAPNIVKRGDWTRVIAEFWADGPASETPPGHWNVLANYVTDHPDLGLKRIGGTGPVVSDLEWDVKIYLVVDGAVHDAAIAAWGTKHFYDSSRPISLIRYMGGLGQSSDPDGPSYHPDGLPLVPGLIEVVTAESSAPGERHEHLANRIGEIAIYAWQGAPDDPETEIGGAGWIRAVEWMTYQADNFVTPPFPGYTSGHSTFSRAGAEALAAFTGSEYFPGGLGTYTAYQNEYLEFEQGPSETVELQWATYADAADEAGLSRRFGGIHPNYDDYPGRVQGRDIGRSAWARAQLFYNRSESGKVWVCHLRPVHKTRMHTLEIAEQAVPAHLAHGDVLGRCEDQEALQVVEPQEAIDPGRALFDAPPERAGVPTFGTANESAPVYDIGRSRGASRSDRD